MRIPANVICRAFADFVKISPVGAESNSRQPERGGRAADGSCSAVKTTAADYEIFISCALTK